MATTHSAVTGSATGRSARREPDAVALLKQDHRTVEQLFAEFEAVQEETEQQQIAERVCQLLTVHTTIEEEIFYPAFLETTQDKEKHHEAELEHNGAKKLIAEIEASGPDDDYYETRVKVLSEMIKHHVKEEEKRDGMFAEAKKADMDLEALGQQLLERKQELMSKMGLEEEEEAETGRRAARSRKSRSNGGGRKKTSGRRRH